MHFDRFWPFLTFLWRHRSKNKVNVIVSCRVRRDLSNAVWIFTLRLLLLKIRRGALWATPSSGRVTRQTSSGRGLTRKTRWYQIRCSTFKFTDFIVEKPFRKILEFWPLVTSILTWAKKMTEMISKWFFVSFRSLPFVFPYGDQEPRSWGRSNAPQQAVENPEAQQGAG